MNTLSRQARIAGSFYLLDVVIAPLRLIYIPGKLFVVGDARATADNLLAHETLFRLGMAGDLACGVVEIFLMLALYRLFEAVDRRRAVLMVALGMFTTPIFFFNVLNDAAALVLARGADFLAAFDRPQRDALAMLFLHLHAQEIVAAEIFWGLWLFPLGTLVYRCGFLPRWLGAWLLLNGCAYLALSAAGLLWPAAADTLSAIVFPAQLGEVVFMLWLLVAGARPHAAAAA